MTPPPPKTCSRCGRVMQWRAKWARNWDTVKYCSDACRRAGAPGPEDRRMEAAISELLAARAATATICPSEAARAVGGADWRPLMETARQAARRMVADGRVEIVQKGRLVDPSTARGPIRIRSKPTGSSS